MAFRVVLVENDVSLNIKLNNLVITKQGDDIWIPMEDVSMIVFDNLSTSITSRVLCQIAEQGIGMVICDQKHLPVGFYSAYDNHSRSTKIIGTQISKEVIFYNKLWTKIVERKIINQSKAYFVVSADEAGRQKIISYINNLEMGDKTNREAHAAKVYFNLLMGSTFSRGNEDILLNSGLDYGYSIIRSYIARLCVGYGLNTQIGIHHRNEFNRFNLVDDLIEPIRPFVDICAYRLLKDEQFFKPEHRRSLINILNQKILYRNKAMYFCNMLDDYVSQFAAMMQNRIEDIIFPDVDLIILEDCEDGL